MGPRLRAKEVRLGPVRYGSHWKVLSKRVLASDSGWTQRLSSFHKPCSRKLHVNRNVDIV